MSNSKSAAKKNRNSANGKKRVVLMVNTTPGSDVYVAGTFNDWNPNGEQLLDKDGDGNYSGTLMLLPGDYEYKFKVNGDWFIDANNPKFTPNGLGTLNSILTVQ
ncbi:MAG: glycogen-binding domain-containing protein [Victivallaceae bacterium]|nr:glycogen-binding domain-containing protein [Victivallaceae bacterium]